MIDHPLVMWFGLALYGAVGFAATWLVLCHVKERKPYRIVRASLICALLFSAGVVLHPTAAPIPMPTLILVAMLLADAATHPSCIPTADGCYGDGESWTVILIPFLVQWCAWQLAFAAFHRWKRGRKARTGADR